MTTTAVLFAVPYADVVAQPVPSCLANSFYGIYGEQAVFKPTESVCVTQFVQTNLPPVVVPLPAGDEQLVWVHESVIDDTLRTTVYDAEVENFFQWLRTDDAVVPNGYQTVLSAPNVVSLVYHNPTLRSALVAVPDDATAYTVSAFLPRYWKASLIPSAPTPFWPVPVPEQAIDHLRRLISSLQYDPIVATIVDGISVDHMRKDIRYLTNEDGTSGFETRHSATEGARLAAAWLKKQFEHAGAACELKEFEKTLAPNVIWYVALPTRSRIRQTLIRPWVVLCT